MKKSFLLLISLILLLALPAQATLAASLISPSRGGAGGKGIDSLPTTPNWSGVSNQLDAHFGLKMAPAGDVNGDGYDDVLASAPDFDGLGGADSGRAYLYLGAASGLPQYPPALPSWWVDGDQAGAYLGSNVAGIGDVNHDGYDDIAISARGYDDGETDEGAVFVWYGGPGANPLPCTITTPPGYCATAADAHWKGESNQAGAGLSTISGGDVNGDHYSDLAVGASGYDNGALADTGAVFVWLGAPNSLGGLNFGDPGIPGLAFWKAYGDRANAQLGYRVAAVDVKHDGQADVIASSAFYNNGHTGEGAVFAWYAPLTVEGSPANANWKVESNQVNAYLGLALDTAGDVNGDNTPDLILAAPYYDNGEVNEGMAFVFHGSASGLPGSGTPGGWQDVYTAANWKVEGNHDNDDGGAGFLGYGGGVGAAGDVNTDGYDDVIFGEPDYSVTGSWRGKAYVFYGSSTGLSCGAGCPVDAGSADWGVAGDQDGARLGYSFAGVGDVNGDHVSDVFVGSPYYDTGNTDGGKAFGYYGISENIPPTAYNDACTGYEDQAFAACPGVLANDTDNGNPNRLTAQLFVGPAHGALTLNADGTYLYTPNANYNGTDSFTYWACDGFACSTFEAQVTLNITPVNDAPSFTKGGNPVVNEDAGAQAIPGWATNISPGPANEAGQAVWFGVSGNTNPALFSAGPVVNGGGTLYFTPAANANGSSTLTLVLQDNGGTANGGQDSSAPQSFTITVNSVNDAPSFTKGSDPTVNEDAGAQTIPNWATNISPGPADESGQTLIFVVTGNSNPGLFSAAPAVSANGALAFTPAANANGSSTLTLVLQDNGGMANGGQDSSAPQNFIVSVTPVNDPPTAVDDAASTAQDTPRTIAVLGNDSDADGDTLSVSAVSDPAHGSVTHNGGDVTYTPDTGYTGADTFNYTCSDGHGGTDTAQVTVNVGNVNDPPTAVNDAADTDEDTDAVLEVLANDTDPDGDTLGIVNLTQPAHGTAVIEGTTMRYTPAANYHGPDSFTYQASDGQAQSNVATVNINVASVNDAPVAVADTASTAEDTAVVISVLANDSDLDGDALSIYGISQAAHGTVAVEGTTVRYTPNADYYGPDNFIYRTNDGQALSAKVMVDITVAAVNDPPVVSSFSALGQMNSPIAFNTANFTSHFGDVDGDELAKIKVTTLPANGELRLNGIPVTINQEIAAADLGGLTFTPGDGWVGDTTFEWTASDGSGYAAAPASVNVTIVGEIHSLYLPLVRR